MRKHVINFTSPPSSSYTICHTFRDLQFWVFLRNVNWDLWYILSCIWVQHTLNAGCYCYFSFFCLKNLQKHAKKHKKNDGKEREEPVKGKKLSDQHAVILDPHADAAVQKLKHFVLFAHRHFFGVCLKVLFILFIWFLEKSKKKSAVRTSCFLENNSNQIRKGSNTVFGSAYMCCCMKQIALQLTRNNRQQQ